MISKVIARAARTWEPARAARPTPGLQLAAFHASPPERRASGAVHVSCRPDALRRISSPMPFLSAPPAPALFRRLALLLSALVGAIALATPALAEDDFLPAKSAYKVAVAPEPGVLVVDFEIAPGYYLYRDRLG